MLTVIKNFFRVFGVLLITAGFILSGFPPSSLISQLSKALDDRNIVDLLYHATRDSNVIDHGLSELFKSDIKKAKAANFQMQTGYYIGNSNAKTISGLGFNPELVLLKPNSTAGTGAIWQSKILPKTTNPYFIATADSLGGLVLEEDGFTVAGANANSLNIGHSWVAFAGSDCTSSGTFCIGEYAGNGAANQTISTGFDPNLVWVKRSTAVAGSWRTSSMGANDGQYFAGTAQDTTGILFQGIGSGGFTVGSTNNTSGGVYYYVAFKSGSNLAVGSYTGNGTSSSVTGLSFSPDFVFVKNSATTGGAVYTTSDVDGQVSWYYTDTANLTTTGFTGVTSDGFTVGTAAEVNGNTNLIYYAAFGGASDTRSTSGTYQMASGTYTGTGINRIINGLSFEPDLVIIKRNSNTQGCFRTSIMGGDTTAYLDAATGNFTGGIINLLPDGFVLGTNAAVNTSGQTYYWVAYGNAWTSDTNSGASDFAIGVYYGSGQNNRELARLPFSPDLVTVKRSGATGGVFRTSSHSSDSSSFFAASADASGHIKSIDSAGFTVGTTANVNTAANYYWYFAFDASSNFVVGSYSGTGSSQNITTGSFSPDNIWVKRTAATQAVERTVDMATNSALPFINAANVNNAITALNATSFTVLSATETNASGSSYWFAAWNSNTSVSSPSPTFKIQTGYYMGNGNGKEITGLGFNPEVVLLKPNSNAGTGAIWQSSYMPNITNSYLIGTTDTTGAISIHEDGFTVAQTNSDTVLVGHSWIAFAGSDCTSGGSICVGVYNGNGGASQTISTGFDPNLVWVKRAASTDAGNWRTSSMGANDGQYFAGTAQNTSGALFQGIGSGGFTVGSTNNTNAAVYYFVAFKSGSNLAVGSYSGNGTSSSVTGLSFSPDFVFVKNSATTGGAVYTTSDVDGRVSWYYTDTAALTTTGFTGVTSDGFAVGTAAEVNGNGNTIYYAAFGGASDTRSTSGNFEMASGSYTGTGVYKTISGLSFAPDLVIIKIDTVAGSFRTSDMGGDTTAYLDAATANYAGGITALLSDGFNVGTSSNVNSLGGTYYWVAYGGAWKNSVNAGATDFLIGTYYGSGQNDYDIGRLPFSPDLISIKRSGATGGVFRTSGHSSDSTSFFAATADASGHIKSLASDGFRVGTTANVNTAANYYWYFAFDTSSNFVVGSYSGTGVSKDVTTGSFSPDNIWVKRTTAVRAVERTVNMATNSAMPFINQSNVNDAITALNSTSFTVLSASETNANGGSYWFAAWNIPSAPTATYELSAYRWFNNTNSTDVGSAIQTQDTAGTLSTTGQAFRLRLLLHVGTVALGVSGDTFKLQFSTKSGSCDTGFSGESYADVTGATDIAYNNNATPADGAALTDNNDDPAHSGHTIVNQTYEEANNFTNSEGAISAGQDGLWDFALIDNGAPASTSYCFRVVEADDEQLDTYTVIPEIATASSFSPELTFSISDNTIGFGTLISGDDYFATSDTNGSATEVEAHTIQASTNATDGYVILASGTTLVFSGFSIDPAGCSNTASTPGSEQYGIRLSASGGNGAVTDPYDGSGFALCTGGFPDEIASDSDGDGVATTYSLRYLANIASNTEAGPYASQISYIIVANF